MEIKSEQLWSLVRPRLRMYLGQTWDFSAVAEVTSSTIPTVSGWLADQTPPAERLIKLWHFMAASGVDSPELEDLPRFNRYCGELLTFGVVDIEELRNICGADTQAVLRMLRGTTPMHPQYTVDELYELYEQSLQEAREGVEAIEVLTPSLPQEQVRVNKPTSNKVSAGESHTLAFAASKLVAVLPLVRHLDSDDCSPEQRSELRRLVGGENIFDLSNHLNNLCSERAREQGRSGSR